MAPEGRKVGLLKRQVRGHLAMRDEKLHAVVARSTFRSQKCKKLTGSDHFWKLRCRESARRCGAKHMPYLLSRFFSAAFCFQPSGSYRHRQCCFLCGAVSHTVEGESEGLIYTNFGRDAEYRQEHLGCKGCSHDHISWAMAPMHVI